MTRFFESSRNFEKVSDSRYRLNEGNFYIEILRDCKGETIIDFQYKTIDLHGIGTYGRAYNLDGLSVDEKIGQLKELHKVDSDNVDNLKNVSSREWRAGLKYFLDVPVYRYFESSRDIEDFLKVAKNSNVDYEINLWSTENGLKKDYVGRYSIEFENFKVVNVNYRKVII